VEQGLRKKRQMGHLNFKPARGFGNPGNAKLYKRIIDIKISEDMMLNKEIRELFGNA
jgi:hypothetical protein